MLHDYRHCENIRDERGDRVGVTGLRWNCSKSLTQRPVTVARFAAFLGSDTGLKTGDSTGKPKPYTYKVH